MSSANHNRDKAAEFKRLQDAAGSPRERREFRKLAQSFEALADNEDWLDGNQGGIVQSADTVRTGGADLVQKKELSPRRVPVSAPDPAQD